jgi:predicted AAA+ superfamily ATPase
LQGHSETLVDTLAGIGVPAWKARARFQEIAHPKFLPFGTEVVRALAGHLLEALERGPRSETFVLDDLRAWIHRAYCEGELSCWRTTSGGEVDFVWRREGARSASR